MIDVAICEDDVVFSEKIKSCIAEWLSEYGSQSRISVFNTGGELMRALKNRSFNIYFFDIELGDDDGVALAGKIRESDNNAIFIFVTSKNDRVYEVFSIDTFGFVRKDHFDTDFNEIMKRLMIEIEKYVSKYIIEGKEKEHLLTINDILYVERIGGMIKIHTISDEIETKYRYFTEFPFNLKENGFGEVYRGIFINYKYLESINSDTVMVTGDIELPISRRKKKEIKDEYKEYLLNL